MNELTRFEAMLDSLSPEAKKDQLPHFHKYYSEKHLKDNDRIWTVSSLFIPLSLAGLSSLKDVTVITIAPLALGSIGLICFWYLVCEKHRKFQDDLLEIIKSTERSMGVVAPELPLIIHLVSDFKAENGTSRQGAIPV